MGRGSQTGFKALQLRARDFLILIFAHELSGGGGFKRGSTRFNWDHLAESFRVYPA